MDKTDIKIMRELLTDFAMPPRDSHVRKSFRSIAKSIKVDQHAVRNRIRRLQEQGVIRRWYIVVNPSLFGLRTAPLQIFLPNNSDKDETMRRISSSFSNNLALLCNHLGQNLIVMLYYKEATELAGNISELKKITNATCVNMLPKTVTECKARLTQSDWQIISSLQKDPWKPHSAISRELRLSSKTIKRRIEALAKEGAVYFLVDVDMKSVEGVIPADLFIFYEDSGGFDSATNENMSLQIAEYLGNQLLFSEANSAFGMDHFALVISNISKSQEIQKWASKRERVKQAYVSILLDAIPQHKLYEELVQGMVKQRQLSARKAEAKSTAKLAVSPNQ